YQLHVQAVGMPGYTPTDVTVDMGSGHVRTDVTLTIDNDLCTAPGYAYAYDGTSTGFEGWTGSTPEDGWTVTDNEGNGQTWAFDDPGNEGNLTGGTGGFAIVDSGLYGMGVQHTALVSPVTDLSDQTDPEIGFDTDYVLMFNWSVLDVSLSLDSGETWTSVWRHSSPNLNGHVSIPVPRAAGKSDVQVRFDYIGHWRGWWELDNAFLGSRSCEPVDGGLVAGVVTDDNTGGGVTGAKVTSDASANEFGVSATTPDDAKLPDGFYWLFSSQTGAGDAAFTVTDSNYTPASGSVDVPGDYVAHQDWTLAAGHLTVDPGNISVNEHLGRHKARTVTFGNDGTEPVHVTLGERDDGFTPMGGAHQKKTPGAPTKRVLGDYRAGSMQHQAKVGKGAQPDTASPKQHTVQLRQPMPSSGPWTDITDYPTPIMDQAVGYHDGLVYSFAGNTGDGHVATAYAYDTGTREWSQIADVPKPLEKPSGAFVGDTFYLVGGWDGWGHT
ncbi:MAG: peptidase S8, partial [Nocardioidaceae bacterium]